MVALIKIRFDPKQFTVVADAFPSILAKHVRLKLTELGVIGRSSARQYAPAAFGFLRNSIDFVVGSSGFKMTLSATAPYAAYVNFGTRPHWIPVDALDDWAKRRGLSESEKHAVRFSIAKRGTKANPFWTRATLFVQHGARRYLEEAVESAVREASQGGA